MITLFVKGNTIAIFSLMRYGWTSPIQKY